MNPSCCRGASQPLGLTLQLGPGNTLRKRCTINVDESSNALSPQQLRFWMCCRSCRGGGGSGGGAAAGQPAAAAGQPAARPGVAAGPRHHAAAAAELDVGTATAAAAAAAAAARESCLPKPCVDACQALNWGFINACLPALELSNQQHAARLHTCLFAQTSLFSSMRVSSSLFLSLTSSSASALRRNRDACSHNRRHSRTSQRHMGTCSTTSDGRCCGHRTAPEISSGHYQ